MKKNLIIGAFTRYNFNQLKPWVQSLDDVGFIGDKVMIVYDTDQNTIDELVKREFKIIQAKINPNLTIHLDRFVYIYNYLKDTWKDYDVVVTTDVKDVYFQQDPCSFARNSLISNKKNLIVGSESIRYKDEPWGNENLMQAYGPYVHDQFKHNVIYNVGVFGGWSECVKDMCFNIFFNGINRPIPIVDQAVFNVLLQTIPFRDTTFFADQKYGWVCHSGTTVDPSKIDSFRPHLVESEPIYDTETGVVNTSEGKPFCCVHQYDRVPVWKNAAARRFNQS